jgi:hypothetical protein
MITMDEYLHALDDLLDEVEMDDGTQDMLVCSTFAVGKQLGWDVEIFRDEEGALMCNFYR